MSEGITFQPFALINNDRLVSIIGIKSFNRNVLLQKLVINPVLLTKLNGHHNNQIYVHRMNFVLY